MKIESLETLAKQHEEQERRAGFHAEATSYAKTREDIFARLAKRDRKGTTIFLKGISAFKYFSDRERGAFLENYYAAMRHIDDVVDGDVSLPEGYESAAQYVQEKIDFIETGRLPRDEIEKILALSFKMATEFKADFKQESRDILYSLLFDAKRHGTHNVFDENTLHDHFFALDIRGTIRGDLKIFGEDPDLYQILEPLGEAVRIYYNLRDFRDDIKAGLVNISSEDCKRLNISKRELIGNYYENHPGVYAWFKEQAEKGLALIEEYHRKRKGVKFKPATEVALKLYFENKEKVFLTAVASGKFEKILVKAA
ncbi:MAG: hypothetical protein AAB661_01190 [Patescibacteria group bacterium]